MTFALLLYSESSVELSAKTTSFPATRCNFESTNINSCVHLILDSPLADVGGVGPQPADGQLSLGVALNGRLGLHLDSGQAVTTITMTVIVTEKNGKEAPVWGVAQFGEMSYPGS